MIPLRQMLQRRGQRYVAICIRRQIRIQIVGCGRHLHVGKDAVDLLKLIQNAAFLLVDRRQHALDFRLNSGQALFQMDLYRFRQTQLIFIVHVGSPFLMT